MGFLSSIFGGQPEAASFTPIKYEPIDYGDQQIDTLKENAAAFPDIKALLDLINQENTSQGIGRIESLSPGFMEGVGSMQDVAASLLRGELPFEDVLDVVRDGQNLRSTLGTPGTHGPATLRDLGLTRMGAYQSGSEFMARIANLAEQVNPVGRQSYSQDWTLAPAQTVPLKQQDAQFDADFQLQNEIYRYNAEQNALNAKNSPNPVASGLFDLALTGIGSLFGGGGGGGGGSAGISQPGTLAAPASAGGGGYGSAGGAGGYPQLASYFNPDSQWGTNYGPGGGSNYWFGA